MGMFKYCTNRTLPDKNGEPDKGKLKIAVRTGSDTAEVDYTCPECGHSDHVEQPWKRPFSVKCSECGALMRAPRLKGKK